MLKIVWVLLMAMCSAVASGQSVGKIYALLNAGQYTEAKAALDKRVTKEAHDPALQYALARYYFETDNPLRQIDSAKRHVRNALQHIGRVTKKGTLKQYHALGVRQFHFEQLNALVDDEAFQRAESQNTVASWNYFLKAFADAPQHADATQRRNRLAFLEAKDNYDLTSFEAFLTAYPDAAEAGQARALFDRLLFEKETREGSWQSFKRFVELHPDNPHVPEARERYDRLLFEDKTRDGSVSAYESFLVQHPTNPHRREAEDSLYRKATQPATVQTLDAFVKKHPSNPHIPEAWKRLYTLAVVDGSTKNILAFLQRYPSYPHRADALRDTALNRIAPEPFANEEGYYGVKDVNSGEIILPPMFWDLEEFSEGWAAATKDDCDKSPCLYGYFDVTGRVRISPRFYEANPFHQGVAIVALGNCPDSCYYGIINRLGDFVSSPVYGTLLPFTHGLSLARRDSLYGFLNKQGKVAVPLIYSDANAFAEGLSTVRDTAGWSIIDTTGRTVARGLFRRMGSFSEGLCAAADEKGIWGYVDRSGSWVIKPQFLDAEPFSDGKAKVFVNASKNPASVRLPRERWIDRNGRFVNQ